MADTEMDLVASLTTEGPQFEESWAKFMFNMDEAQRLRAANQDEILLVLQAGSKFMGTGWTTGKASKALFQLSGVPLVKASVQPYRDTWLFALALILNVDLPAVELAQECADAAFAVAACLDGRPPTSTPHTGPHATESEEESEEDVKFQWDEQATDLPRELQVLWARAQAGEGKIDIRKLLEAHPRFSGLPSRSPENNLCPEYRKKTDNFLKAVSQQLLNVVRLLAYNWVHPVVPEVQLQVWQYVGELYAKLQEERKDLAVPGRGKAKSPDAGEVLFTEEDVKAQRMERNLSGISMTQARNVFCSKGGSYCPVGQSFRLSTESHARTPWRGRPQGPPGKGGFKGRSWQGASSSWQGGTSFNWKGSWKGKGGKAKGVPSPGQGGRVSQGGSTGHDGINGQGGKPQCEPHSSGPIRSLTTLCQVEGSVSVVAKARTPIRPPAHLGGCGTQVQRARSVPIGSEKTGGGSKTRLGSHERVHRGQSYPRSTHGRNQVLGSLVCHPKGGCQCQGEKPPHLGLPANQLRVKHTKVQVRPLERHLSKSRKRHVGHKGGSEKRLFSFGAFKGTQTIHMDEDRGKNLSNGRGMFWPKHTPLSLDGGHAGVLEKVAKRRPFGLHLFGRHLAFGKVKKSRSQANRKDVDRSTRKWHDGKLQKLSTRSLSKGGTFGVLPQSTPRGSSSPEFNAQDGEKIIGNFFG